MGHEVDYCEMEKSNTMNCVKFSSVCIRAAIM